MYYLQISSMLGRKYLIMVGNYYHLNWAFNFCKNTELQFFSKKILGSKSSSRYLVVWVCWYLLDILSGNWEVPASHVSTTFLSYIVVPLVFFCQNIAKHFWPHYASSQNMHLVSLLVLQRGLTEVWYQSACTNILGKICNILAFWPHIYTANWHWPPKVFDKE